MSDFVRRVNAETAPDDQAKEFFDAVFGKLVKAGVSDGMPTGVLDPFKDVEDMVTAATTTIFNFHHPAYPWVKDQGVYDWKLSMQRAFRPYEPGTTGPLVTPDFAHARVDVQGPIDDPRVATYWLCGDTLPPPRQLKPLTPAEHAAAAYGSSALQSAVALHTVDLRYDSGSEMKIFYEQTWQPAGGEQQGEPAAGQPRLGMWVDDRRTISLDFPGRRPGYVFMHSDTDHPDLTVRFLGEGMRYDGRLTWGRLMQAYDALVNASPALAYHVGVGSTVVQASM